MAETTIAADSIDETTDADMMIVVAGTDTMTVAEDMTDMTIAEEAAMTVTMIAEKVIDMVIAEKVTGTGTDEETDMASDETTETETDTEAAGSIKMRQQRFREKCFFIETIMAVADIIEAQRTKTHPGEGVLPNSRKDGTCPRNRLKDPDCSYKNEQCQKVTK